MTEYNPKSLKAEEFINDAEIRATLAYADEHKNDLELVDKIIEKAKLKKGLTHREASVLLACDDKEKIAEIYDLAEQIKKDFYGNRIVMFAPLYLSNYCVNGCVYCPYHAKNKTIARKKQTQEEKLKEAESLCESASAELEKTTELMEEVAKQYEELISYADLYAHATFEAKKMIVNQLIRRVDVYRGYQISVSFNFNLSQYFEGIDSTAC